MSSEQNNNIYKRLPENKTSTIIVLFSDSLNIIHLSILSTVVFLPEFVFLTLSNYPYIFIFFKIISQLFFFLFSPVVLKVILPFPASGKIQWTFPNNHNLSDCIFPAYYHLSYLSPQNYSCRFLPTH